MAASEKGHPRRRRRRQLKQQQVPQRQEIARTPSDRSGLSKPQKSIVSGSSASQRRSPRTQGQNRDRLHWWEKLFGQRDREAAIPAKKHKGSKVVKKGNISHLSTANDDLWDGLNILPPQSPDRNSVGLTAVPPVPPPRDRIRPNPIPPYPQMGTSRNSKDIPQLKSQQRKLRMQNDRSRRPPQKSLVGLPPSGRQLKSPILKNDRRQESKKAGLERVRKSPQRFRSPDSAIIASIHPRRNPVKKISSPQQRRNFPSTLVYGTRLLILGIGLGVVVGTMLSIWNPVNRQPGGVSSTPNPSHNSNVVADISLKPASTLGDNLMTLRLTQEIPPLRNAIQSIMTEYSQLAPAIFILDLDTGTYLDWKATSPKAAASTIKVPILVAFFQDVDAGKIRLDEELTLREEDRADGSGKMQYKQPGTKFSALETATQMIIHSDNSATNMLIARLGGSQVLNQRFREWGLTATEIRNKLPDIEGTNTTSAKELGTLMARVNQGELVSLRSRDRLLDIMRRTANNSLLPRGLGKEATIAHKTGNIGSMLADVGLIDLPSGKRYIASVMVQRPRNDTRATQLINKISRVTYQYFSKSISTPKLPIGDGSAPDTSIPSPATPTNRLEDTQSVNARNRD
ncbi:MULTISPECIES: serine hydrolase [Aerosakkonema]|uniref:serine hydrolase n=1 Tax=Aerosakkonema TaxID=1246629 RepID=UPI0035B73BAD